MRSTLLFRNLVGVICMLMLLGCDQSPQERLVGVWKESLISRKMEFYSDGTFRMELLPEERKGRRDSAHGSWVILNDGRLKLDSKIRGNIISAVVVLQFEGNHMVLIDENDKSTVYVKL